MSVSPPVFIASKTQDDGNTAIENTSFFPSINLLHFQSRYRLNDKVSPEEQVEALENALGWVNGDLMDVNALDQPAGVDENGECIESHWVDIQKQKGYETLADVPDLPGGTATKIYLTAVYSKAKAELLDENQDDDQTHSGTKADAINFKTSIEKQREKHMQKSRECIRELLGISRVTIELL